MKLARSTVQSRFRLEGSRGRSLTCSLRRFLRRVLLGTHLQQLQPSSNPQTLVTTALIWQWSVRNVREMSLKRLMSNQYLLKNNINKLLRDFLRKSQQIKKKSKLSLSWIIPLISCQMCRRSRQKRIWKRMFKSSRHLKLHLRENLYTRIKLRTKLKPKSLAIEARLLCLIKSLI